MPLDGHSYLVAQGWSGRGSGLREGSISRPLAIPQKKTLSGLGKDRDEAFPFWDHLYALATKAIKIKVHKDEDDKSSSDTDSPASPVVPALTRTRTGILSNRRPITGTPASSSGSSTPTLVDPSSSASRMNLMVVAKREAAKRGLYSRFFRGPVLGPDCDVKAEDSLPTKCGNPEEGLASEAKGILQSRPVVNYQSDNDKEAEDRKEKKLRKKEKEQAGERRKEVGKRKRKETGSGVYEQDGSAERTQRTEEIDHGEEVAVKVSEKKKKRRKDATDELPNDAVGDGGQKRSKKRMKKDGAADTNSWKGNEQKPWTQEETKEERRRRREERRKRKEQKEGRRRGKEAAS